MYLLIPVFLMMIGLLIGIYSAMSERRERHRLLDRREWIPEDKIWETYFRDCPKTEFLDAWRSIANVLGVQGGRLRPSDHLDSLRGPDLYCDGDVDELAKLIPAYGTSEPSTVEELVREILAGDNT